VAQYRRPKRAVNGVLLLDKPAGISSNGALQCAKRLYQAAKAGHTGSLDPFATGLLPICFGEATKFSRFLLDADKTYQGRVRLGVTTATGDPEGAVLERSAVAVSRRQLEDVLQRFTGPILQVPPMHSALKHDGKALYEYARQGLEVERQARAVTIHAIRLEDFAGESFVFTVRCSKGTYIRTLAEDIGAALGCGAHLESLRRLASGAFSIEEAYSLDALEAMDAAARDALLRPLDSLLEAYPRLVLDGERAFCARQGQPVWLPRMVFDGTVRLYGEDGVFLGIGEVMDDGRVAPRRLVAAGGA
jgi:tRNA pseudouridine55 synthase